MKYLSKLLKGYTADLIYQTCKLSEDGRQAKLEPPSTKQLLEFFMDNPEMNELRKLYITTLTEAING